MTCRINMARWQPHVEEARRRGVSLKAYAAEQGLSLYSLYRASQVLRQGDAVEPSTDSRARRRSACSAFADSLKASGTYSRFDSGSPFTWIASAACIRYL